VTYLLDTNVLIYPHDDSAPNKNQRARALLQALERSGEAVVPAQALAEFANVALRKFRLPLDLVYKQIEDLSHAFPIVPLSEWVVMEAVRGVETHRFSYYDAQIWAAAKLHRVPIVLTEDFPIGSTIEGVAFIDPFAESFDLDRLG
jgi:predicted nucleic acid-binding protein